MSDASIPTPPRRRRRKFISWAFLALFLLPVLGALGLLAYQGGPTHWSQWDRSITSQLGDAASHPEARVMVMSGRTRGWKGALAVHSWVVIKHENERRWSRYDVAGWGNPVRLNWWPPDPLVRLARRRSGRPQGRAGRGADPEDRGRDQELPVRQRRRLPHLAGTEQQHVRRDRAARRAGARRHDAAQRDRP